jgi:hypothetical protein
MSAESQLENALSPLRGYREEGLNEYADGYAAC